MNVVQGDVGGGVGCGLWVVGCGVWGVGCGVWGVGCWEEDVMQGWGLQGDVCDARRCEIAGIYAM